MSVLPTDAAEKLPSDRRFQLGGTLFLVSLLIFFLTSILLYGIYAYTRRDDPQRAIPLPSSLLVSTALLIGISGLVHLSTRTVRRDRNSATCLLLVASGVAAIVFMAIQFNAMDTMLGGPAWEEGTGRGVVGMVAVLAFLHALHVAGGVVALAIVSIRSLMGRYARSSVGLYDHERHWPVDFAARYWHCLDLVWLCMLAAFWCTTGGFAPLAG